MEKMVYTNGRRHVVFVGGVMIPPGESREVDRRLIPPSVSKPAEQPDDSDPLAELAKGTVADITAALAGLSLEEVERLGEIEQAGQARKGVLGAIAEILLASSSREHGGSIDDDLGEGDANPQ